MNTTFKNISPAANPDDLPNALAKLIYAIIRYTNTIICPMKGSKNHNNFLDQFHLFEIIQLGCILE